MNASLGLLATMAVLLLSAGTSPVRAQEVRVKIIVILATDQNKNVDRDLECIAKEIQKTQPKLTGFHVEKIIPERSLKVSQEVTFYLGVEDEEIKVRVQHGANEANRVSVKLKLPSNDRVDYTTCCDKFFPIMTRYVTKEKERLIIAVRVSPCKDQLAKPTVAPASLARP
jgi:hypothetical protein